MLIPCPNTVARFNEILDFADALSHVRVNFEGTRREKARHQYFYSKFCELAVAEYFNTNYPDANYQVSMDILTKPNWDPDLISENSPNIEVKTSLNKTWVFQYPYYAIKYPSSAPFYLSSSSKIDDKFLNPHNYGETLVALTSFVEDSVDPRVYIDYLIPLGDVLPNLAGMKKPLLNADKSALYDKDLKKVYFKFGV